MGTSTTGAQFAAKLERLGKDLNDPKVALNATGLAGKRIFEASAAGAGALGVKPKGKRKLVGARYDMGKGATSVVVTYTGPAHLINNPTRPHRIEPRRPRGGRSRRRGASALTINGDVRAWANHPGTRGRDFYSKARAICVNKLPNVYAKAGITAPLSRIF
jgi:hypothetical protein